MAGGVNMTTTKIIHGDCLEQMKLLPSREFDAVVTDPPYMVGSISVGNESAKAGTWADMENSAYWFAAWMTECKRLLKPTGHLLTFGSWRSIPTLIRALSLCDLSAQSCMVWDKLWIGPGGTKGLRPRYEVCIFATMSDGAIEDRSIPDIHAEKWSGNMRTTEHPAEKPVALVSYLLGLVVPNGGLVLDPFCGSGTTGVAAAQRGVSFVGIEREAKFVEVARERCANPPLIQSALFEVK